MESVRCLPPGPSRPSATRRASSRSNTFSSNPCSTTRERNSLSTVWSNPGSSRSRPSAYIQSIRVRAASAACRSVRSSAICNTVTNANRPGDHPGRPRSPNAEANSASGNTSPSRSRTCTANGARRRAYFFRTAATTTSAGFGHGRGCTDTTDSILRPDEGKTRGRRPQAE